MVESAQQKLPTFSKSQLRNKVREISDFVDNRWQVRNLFPISLVTKEGCQCVHSHGTSCSKKDC